MNLVASAATLLADTRNHTGESPVWSATENAVYWLDIPSGEVFRLRLGEGDLATWKVPGPVGSLALASNGKVLVAAKHGFVLLDPASGATTAFGDPPDYAGHVRFNDGKVGPDGRFWVGCGDMRLEKSPCAPLYRLCGDGKLTAVGPADQVMSNGLAWSPDGKCMYHSDSRLQCIWRYRFDSRTGEASERSMWLQPPAEWGAPDGAAMDEDGYYWSCGFGASRINRISPDGRLDAVIQLPVSQPTMCCFGGDDMKTLFVCSMRARLAETELLSQSWSGGLIAIRVGVRGAPVPQFRLHA